VNYMVKENLNKYFEEYVKVAKETYGGVGK